MKSIPLQRLMLTLSIVLSLALSGCNLAQPQPTQEPGRIETIVAQTLAAVPSSTPEPTSPPTEPPAPTDTAIPTETLVPSDTLAPTDTPVPTATQTSTVAALPTDTQVPAGGSIVFKSGGTTGSVQGNLSANDAVQYLLRAMGGQLMILSVTSPQDQAILSVKGEQSGEVLLAKSKGWIRFRTYLPSNQRYVLGISSSAATSYLLTADVPARVRFETGAYSATVTGKASSGPNISYVLRAMQGQTMTLEVDSAGDHVYLAAYGYDTWNELVDPDDRLTEASFELPKSEDYVVYAIQGNNPADFTLTVTIK